MQRLSRTTMILMLGTMIVSCHALNSFPELRGGQEVDESRCLVISPDPIAFGASSIDEQSTTTLVIQNACAAQEIGIFGISITANQDSVFSIEDPVAGLQIIDAGASISVTIGFRPTEAKTYGGTILIRSGDAPAPRVIVPLTGEGSSKPCPVAVAQASLDGTTFVENLDDVRPLETVTLDARASTPDGEISEYRWTIVVRPDRSRATLNPNSRVLQPDVFLDRVGTYIFELGVSDADGVRSCNVSRVTVIARPNDGHYLELSWQPVIVAEAPIDLNLYYRKDNADWGTEPGEVGVGTGPRDWGGEARLVRQAADPRSTPEVIFHPDPAPDLYFVGVHYANVDDGHGPVIAALRLFVDGVETYDGTQRIQGPQEQFWSAFLVSGTTGEVDDDGSRLDSSFPP